MLQIDNSKNHKTHPIRVKFLVSRVGITISLRRGVNQHPEDDIFMPSSSLPAICKYVPICIATIDEWLRNCSAVARDKTSFFLRGITSVYERPRARFSLLYSSSSSFFFFLRSTAGGIFLPPLFVSRSSRSNPRANQIPASLPAAPLIYFRACEPALPYRSSSQRGT